MANETTLNRAKHLRSEMTPWERKLWYTFLRKYPIHIYRQRPIGPYIVDYYCAVAKLAIELDGSQHYTDDLKEYDAERTAYLEGKGIKVMRFANIDIDKRFREVCAQIDHEIRKRLGERENDLSV